MRKTRLQGGKIIAIFETNWEGPDPQGKDQIIMAKSINAFYIHR
jgi:hypothetical protein